MIEPLPYSEADILGIFEAIVEATRRFGHVEPYSMLVGIRSQFPAVTHDHFDEMIKRLHVVGKIIIGSDGLLYRSAS